VLELVEQLQKGCIPWRTDAAAAGLAHIKQQLSLLAYDLRAARQEQDLVLFEVDACERSLQQEAASLAAAAAEQRQAGQQLLQQCERWQAEVEASNEHASYALHCEQHQRQVAAAVAQARTLLLQRQADATRQRSHAAVLLFQRFKSDHGSSRGIVAGAAAAAAADDDSASDCEDAAPHDDSDSDGEDAGDAGMLREASGAASGSSSGVAGAATDAPSPAPGVQQPPPVPARQPAAGPDRVIQGDFSWAGGSRREALTVGVGVGRRVPGC
jgi:hypothetical protein